MHCEDYALIEKTTTIGDNLPLHIVDNAEVVDEKTPYVHVCTRYDILNEPTTGKSDENTSKKRQDSDSTVRTKERQTTKVKVSTIDDFIVEHTNDAFCRKATTQL